MGVDVDTNKISFSMREGGFREREPREPVDLGPFEGIGPSTWLQGTVASTTAFGAFVKVQAPDSEATAQGLVHITNIADGFIESVDDEVEVGQEVKVRVINVDVAGGKMGLSMKEEESFD